MMLGRSRRRTAVIDDDKPRNRFAEHMHGVLGHDGVDPAELVARGRDEVAGYGVEFVGDRVVRVDDVTGGLLVTTSSGEAHTTRAVIVASGITDRLPDIPGLAERWGTTVLHCPYCHGWEVRDQRLGVLTSSPLGLHQAELIRQWSDDVVVFAAGLGELAAATEARLMSRGIELVLAPVTEVVGDGTAISAVRTADGQLTPVDAILTAPTPEPRDDFLRHLGLDRTTSPWGSFLTIDPMTQRSSHPRIWAAGNVVHPAASVPVAMGAGSTAGAMANLALVTEDFDLALGR